jgi:MOSC domain-containing protein YiiM
VSAYRYHYRDFDDGKMKERCLILGLMIFFTLALSTEGWFVSNRSVPTAGVWRGPPLFLEGRWKYNQRFTSNTPLLLSSAKTTDHDNSNKNSDLDIDVAVSVGRVIRVAAREYHAEDSKPSSRKYTTRKVARDSIQVSKEGVATDYNHYRTLALKGTPDRALSILTTDCMELLQSHKFPVRDGDLGENVLVEGIDYRFFVPGNVYLFTTSTEDGNEVKEGCVIVEITEPMPPCGNLCKLPYINDPEKTPKERVATCQEMLNVLDQESGLRGWYAKVLQGGIIGTDYRVCRIH